jgi:hypothetical protein
VAQGLIDSIRKIVDLKSQGILNSFNGIDIDQRREYVKVSYQFNFARMLKAHSRQANTVSDKRKEFRLVATRDGEYILRMPSL